MSAKDLLRQVRNEMLEIKIKQDELERIKLGLFPKAIIYKPDKVQESVDEDKTGNTFAKTDDLERKIAESIKEMHERYIEAYDLVEKLTDSAKKQVLHLYYLSGNLYSVNQVGEILGYSDRQVFRILNEALGELNGINDNADT